MGCLDGAWCNEILSLVRFALTCNDANELLTESYRGGIEAVVHEQDAHQLPSAVPRDGAQREQRGAGGWCDAASSCQLAELIPFRASVSPHF
jgi:hypothetical protein